MILGIFVYLLFSTGLVVYLVWVVSERSWLFEWIHALDEQVAIELNVLDDIFCFLKY